MRLRNWICLALSVTGLAGTARGQWRTSFSADPPEEGIVAEFELGEDDAGPCGKLVEDPGASGGRAVRNAPGSDRKGYMVSGGWTPCRVNREYGLHLLVRRDPAQAGVPGRLRIEAVCRSEDREFIIWWVYSSFDGFKEDAGRYGYYSLKFQHQPRGELGFRVYWAGPADAWIDRALVTERMLPDEDEQLKTAGFARPSELEPVGKPAARIVAPRGVYYWTYRTKEFGPAAGGDIALVHALPKTHAEMWQYDAVVLPNFDLSAPPGYEDAAMSLEARAVLEDFVKQGGGLTILGGPNAFGKGGTHRVKLRALWPFETTGPFDIHELDPPRPLVPAGDHPIVRGLDWAAEPQVFYRHRVRLKPGAQVVLEAGGEPILAVWERGNGRVAAFAVTPFGAAPDTGPPAFWQWEDWPRLMGKVINWTRGRQDAEVQP